MFDALTEKLQNVFKTLRGRGRLSEADVEAALREIKLALLEADVNFRVVKEFIGRIKERAVGQEVLQSVTPAQQVVKIVYDELVALLGSTESKLLLASQPPTIIMLVGLQGSGKTTATAKLAYKLKSQGKNPLMIAADTYRPAAIDQLVTLGRENNLSVFTATGTPVEIVKAGLNAAKQGGQDVVLIDTAGRLHVDEDMMVEAEQLKDLARPHQILLVVDAMTGQDAVNVATSFQQRLDFDGLILTKLDGDARGGAALSIRAVSGKPIKFVSLGEKINSLEVFHPDRLASRILGMGDVLTLVEKAQALTDAKKAAELEKKMRQMSFDLEDFLAQLKQLKNLGPISQVIKMLPGMAGNKALKNMQVSDKDLVKIQAIIESMTPEERRRPEIISGSRRSRIAKGSGSNVSDVNQLLKQFEQTKKLMKAMMGAGKRVGKMKLPFFS